MIDKLVRARTAAGVVVAIVLSAGVAVAATETGSRPTVAGEDATTSVVVDDSSTSSSVVDSSTSTSVDDSTTSTSVDDSTTSTTAAPSTSTTAGPGEFKNHGACVSAAAHDAAPGQGHGQAVSEVAKSDCGKQSASGGEDTQETPEGTEPSTESGGAGHGNSGGHGNSAGHGQGNS